jgi:flagella basal body P-ring formation protein FlgA
MNRFLLKTVFLLTLSLAFAGSATAAELDTELVRVAIEERARLSLPDTVVAVSVRGVQVRGTVGIPAGAKVEVVVHSEGDEDWIGRVAAEAEVYAGGKLVRTVRILATVVAQVRVAVLRNPVSRGQLIGASDVGEALREADRLPSGIVMTAAALVGRRAKRDLSLNRLVTEGELVERTDAQRNRPVTLVVRNGGLIITSPGILRKDARIGDLVEVLSTATRGTVYGILINPDVVEVPTTSATTSQSFSAR